MERGWDFRERHQTFFDYVNDAHPWGILFLQETFRRTEGLAPEVGTNSDSDGHLIYTTSELLGGLIAMWAPLIFSKWLPLDKRMNASKTAIGSSLTWLAGTWHLTKAQASKLKSLAARTAGRVKGIRRTPGPPSGDIFIEKDTECVGKIRCRPSARAPLAGAQTASIHCKDGQFNHPENCNDNEATGLVAVFTRRSGQKSTLASIRRGLSAGDGKRNSTTGAG